MPPADESERDAPERDVLVEELRKRFLEGTLDEVLIPDDADVRALLAELKRTVPPPSGGGPH